MKKSPWFHAFLVLGLLLVFTFVSGCDPAEKTADFRDGPNTGSVAEIVIRDAYGDCWLLRDQGKGQSWVPMKPDVCEHRPAWLTR